MSLITVEEISKIYNGNQNAVYALDTISLDIKEKEFVTIMGPSGSGKTTLLSVLGGLNPPSKGNIQIDEIDIYALGIERLADFRREYFGFVFQEFQLIPYLTALENVMLPLCISDHSASDHSRMARTVLDKVGLTGKYNRLPNQLSGGEQQRVAIARAIVNDPPIIFADEPTGTLDTGTGEEVMHLFGMLKDEGQTIVMVTHNPKNAHFSDRTINLKDGRLD
jgi:putative ABC transport system ATP-binding protein